MANRRQIGPRQIKVANVSFVVVGAPIGTGMTFIFVGEPFAAYPAQSNRSPGQQLRLPRSLAALWAQAGYNTVARARTPR
jgi:hypothetical protein